MSLHSSGKRYSSIITEIINIIYQKAQVLFFMYEEHLKHVYWQCFIMCVEKWFSQNSNIPYWKEMGNS